MAPNRNKRTLPSTAFLACPQGFHLALKAACFPLLRDRPPIWPSLNAIHALEPSRPLCAIRLPMRESKVLPEAERKMGQLLELPEKNMGAKGIGPICRPWFVLVYSGCTRKTVAIETSVGVHPAYFFPLAWSTAAFSSGSLTSDNVRSNNWPPIFRRT
jgi:hypothetical protein